MGTRALLGIAMDDGSMLAIHLCCDADRIMDILLRNYGERQLAASLFALGDLLSIGATPETCQLSPREAEATLCVDWDDFHSHRLANEEYVYVFDRIEGRDEMGWHCLDYTDSIEDRFDEEGE